MKKEYILPWIPVYGTGYVMNCYFNYNKHPEGLGEDINPIIALNATYQGLCFIAASQIYLLFN